MYYCVVHMCLCSSIFVSISKTRFHKIDAQHNNLVVTTNVIVHSFISHWYTMQSFFAPLLFKFIQTILLDIALSMNNKVES